MSATTTHAIGGNGSQCARSLARFASLVEGARELLREGLLPKETVWFALRVATGEPAMLEAEWNISREHYHYVGQFIPDLIEQGILPEHTREFRLTAGDAKVVRLWATWVPTASALSKVLSALSQHTEDSKVIG